MDELITLMSQAMQMGQNTNLPHPHPVYPGQAQQGNKPYINRGCVRGETSSMDELMTLMSQAMQMGQNSNLPHPHPVYPGQAQQGNRSFINGL